MLELEDLSRPLLESSDESAASSPTEDPPPVRLIGEYDDDHERRVALFRQFSSINTQENPLYNQCNVLLLSLQSF